MYSYMDEMRSIIDIAIPTKLNIFMNEIRFVNITAVTSLDEVPRCVIEKLIIFL